MNKSELKAAYNFNPNSFWSRVLQRNLAQKQYRGAYGFNINPKILPSIVKNAEYNKGIVSAVQAWAIGGGHARRINLN